MKNLSRKCNRLAFELLARTRRGQVTWELQDTVALTTALGSNHLRLSLDRWGRPQLAVMGKRFQVAHEFHHLALPYLWEDAKASAERRQAEVGAIIQQAMAYLDTL